MNKEYKEMRERVASRFIVDCGYDSEYPCPHAHPTMGYEPCPHLDEDICMWQREQADQLLALETDTCRIAVVKKNAPLPEPKGESLYPDSPLGKMAEATVLDMKTQMLKNNWVQEVMP